MCPPKVNTSSIIVTHTAGGHAGTAPTEIGFFLAFFLLRVLFDLKIRS